MEITHARAKELFHQAQRAKAHIAKVKEKAEQSIGHAKLAVEVWAAAGLMGYLNVKNSPGAGAPWQLFGFDADMALGLAGAGLAMAGIAGKYDEDLLGVALGAGASWANREGAIMAATAPTTTTTPAATTAATQAAGAVSAGQYAGALPAMQYVGAINAAGHWVTAHQQTGALPAGQYVHGITKAGQLVYPMK
jgi:hypothetical protein